MKLSAEARAALGADPTQAVEEALAIERDFWEQRVHTSMHGPWVQQMILERLEDAVDGDPLEEVAAGLTLDLSAPGTLSVQQAVQTGEIPAHPAGRCPAGACALALGHKGPHSNLSTPGG